MEELISVESKLNNKSALDQIVKSFVYDQDLSMKDNLKVLSSRLIDYFEAEGKAA